MGRTGSTAAPEDTAQEKARIPFAPFLLVLCGNSVPPSLADPTNLLPAADGRVLVKMLGGSPMR